MRLSFAVAALLVSAPAAAQPPASGEADPVQAAIREVLVQEGFPLEAAGVAVVNEGSRLSITIDVSQGLTAYLASRIAERLAADRPDVQNVKVDMKVFGSAQRLSENAAPVASTQWKDALSRSAQSGGDEALGLSQGAERPHPEHLANFVVSETEQAGRMIILKHLKEIEESGRMSNLIATDGYWREVFASQGYEDVYAASREMLKKALRAGLRPYKQGKGLNAKEFSILAAKAIEPPIETAAAPMALVQP